MTWATAAAVVGLGLFHGLNPAMGWLFAVALGLQERAGAARGDSPGRAAVARRDPAGRAAVARRDPAGRAAVARRDPAGPALPGRSALDRPVLDRPLPDRPALDRPVSGGRAADAAVADRHRRPARLAVLRALPPIAAGHLVSVAAVAAAFAATESVVASHTVAIGAGAVVVGLGMWRLLSARHFRWVGMRLSGWELATWSFLMSSVHGAGLMLVPVLAHHSPLPLTASVSAALAASLLHATAMLAMAATAALLVLEVLGLAVLHHAWFDVDRIWAIALVAAGAITALSA